MKQTLKKWVRQTGLRKQHLAAVRMCCERHVLATLKTGNDKRAGRILCYHSIGQPIYGVNDVDPRKFRRHIELALSAGYRFVPASEIVRTGGGPKDLAITFDDGLKSVATVAAPILAPYRIPWSIFVVSGWSDLGNDWATENVLGWRDLERLAAAGAEIGSHSVTHPNFAELEPSRIVDELGESRRAIDQRLGIDTKSFAIPFGQSGNWTALAADAAREVGYEVVFAQAEETRPKGTVARTFVTRFDADRIFRALLSGAFDRWEEWF